jgi:hypothetical protein
MDGQSAEFRGREFVDVDMSDALFREVDLSRVRMRGVLLIGADLDGAIDGLSVNGVEVAPLVEAELDRRHPERAALHATTPEGVREAWRGLEEMWAATVRRAESLSEADRQRSVDGEWSLVDTLRHLIFVTDAWFGHAVEGRSGPFHRFGLPATFSGGAEAYGIEADAAPTFDEVMDVRRKQFARVEEFLAESTQNDLDRVRDANPAPGWPPPERRTAIACLHVIFNDEWAHHRFAVRDLDAMAKQPAD